MTRIRPESTPKPKAKPAGAKASPTDPPATERDRLKLSPHARRSVQAEATPQDLSLRVSLGSRTRLTGRYIHGSSTMMQGAGLLKLDHEFSPTTTAFAGVGHMPGFFRHSVGPNERIGAPHSAVFAGIEDRRGASWGLGRDLRLDLGMHSVAVGTLAYNHERAGIDPSSSTGLSKASTTAEATLTRRFGSLEASLGYGNHVDLGMAGTYYVTGGSGLFPQTHFIQSGLKGQAGSMDFRVDGYLPLSTASNEFAATPMLRAQAGSSSPYMPVLSVVASTEGLERLSAEKSWRLAEGLDASARVSMARPFDSPEVSAGVGLRYSFGRSKAKSALSPERDWREQPRTRLASDQAPVSQPRLRDTFSREQIADMRGKSVEELAGILKTPEQVVAYLAEFVSYDDDRLANPGGDYGSLTPNEVARLLKGVCRDQHPFLVSVMKEGGIEGRTIGYMSPDTSHAIAVYRDPDSGKWNVIEYGRIHHTQADTAEEAFDRVRPDALVSGGWSSKGPDEKNFQNSIRYSETAREWYRFVQPSKSRH